MTEKILVEISHALREASSDILREVCKYEPQIDGMERLQLLDIMKMFDHITINTLIDNKITEDDLSRLKNASTTLEAVLKKTRPYETNTFKCKSDVDSCLANSYSITDKMLCIALFTRCVAKG